MPGLLSFQGRPIAIGSPLRFGTLRASAGFEPRFRHICGVSKVCVKVELTRQQMAFRFEIAGHGIERE
jgi:hypothetical protein